MLSAIAEPTAREADAEDFGGVSRVRLIRRIRALLAQRAADILTIRQHEATIAQLEARIVLLCDEPTSPGDVAAQLMHLANLVGSGKAA